MKINQCFLVGAALGIAAGYFFFKNDNPAIIWAEGSGTPNGASYTGNGNGGGNGQPVSAVSGMGNVIVTPWATIHRAYAPYNNRLYNPQYSTSVETRNVV